MCLAGCHRTTPACSKPPEVELRDGQGVLLESLVPVEPNKWDRCDAEAHVVGTVIRDGNGSAVLDRQKMLLHLVRMGASDGDFSSPAGPRGRIHVEATEISVLRPNGVPFGTIGMTGTEIAVRDPAGRPIGRVEPQAAGVVFLDADGVGRRLVTPARTAADRTLAGLFGIPGLTDEERGALYLLWSR